MDSFIIILFIAAFGGCVGSFINVIAFRLPEGQSIHWPPSQCQNCKTPLRWWENVPVFAWFYLGGQCRTCKSPISKQYPLVEAICTLLFVLLYVAYYSPSLGPMLDSPYVNWGVAQTWPVYIVHLVLLAGLLASTLIDARHFIIPLQIPWFVTLVALIGLPLYGHFMPDPVMQNSIEEAVTQSRRVVPVVNELGVNFAAGGMVGLGLSIVLMHLRILPRSFDDEEAHQLDAMETAPPSPEQPAADAPATEGESVEGNPETELTSTQKAEMFLTYSHPRREVLKEALFVAIPFFMAIAAAVYSPIPIMEDSPVWIKVLGGVCCGYLTGGAIVWITRIFGTLGFGREAMGLGDVHLLAAIGAVLGWGASIATFFVAPFFGLGYVVIAVGISKAFKKREVKIIPYGPYLAGAAVLVMVARDPIVSIFIR